jgi:hypothetical protein
MVSKKTRKRTKVSKRVLEMWNDPETVWGKNKELEKFWGQLASGKKVVLIYKDKTHKYVNEPKRFTKKHETMFNEFKEDNNILAILSSPQSQDAYEQYLYPKAKDKSVNYVIEHYTKYFKPITAGEKLWIPLP